ncbi:hypothetical protein [Aeoliella sp. SH292]|uniref:hypothetical protein n=1 Tax=Aeoliella sp. SH292 TaxID=3454464 RepID=UPI003F9B22AA
MSAGRTKRQLPSCVAFAVVILFAESCLAQVVYNIPPGSAPNPSLLSPGSTIRLGEGGRLSIPYNTSSGALGAYTIPAGVLLDANGGWIDSHLTLDAGARAEMSGGTVVGSMETRLGSELMLQGTDFQVDGVPVASLVELGDETFIGLSDGQLLTGRLADGTPFAFSSHDWQPSATRSYPSLPWSGGDRFAMGSLRLVETEATTPTPGTTIHSASSEFARRWIGDAEVLELQSFGRTPVGFTAGPGSKVIINALPSSSGSSTIYGVANDFEAIGAEVELKSGTIGIGADLFAGSHLTMTGGRIDPYMQVHNGSTLDVQGGDVAYGLALMPGGTVNVQGGVLGSTTSYYPYYSYPQDRVTTAYAGSLITLTGGSIPSRVTLFPGARMEQSGGTMTGQAEILAGATYHYAGGFAQQLTAQPGANIEIVGGEFTIGGVPVEGLGTNPGDTLEIAVPSGAFLSGILADGHGFVLSPDDGTNLTPATLRLVRAELAPAEPGTIVVPPDAAPLTARAGQTIRVEQQGSLPGQFVAGIGSRIEVAGGSVGFNSRYVGAELVVEGGNIGSTARLYEGTTAVMHDGVISVGFTANNGTSFEMNGGLLHGFFRARSGSDVDIRGGRVMSDFVADAGSSLRLVGSEFRVDGVPVSELVNVGDSSQLNLVDGQLLTGVLSDGTGVAFHYDDGDRIATGALTLELSAPAAVGPAEITLTNNSGPASIGRGQRLTVQTGGRVRDNFIAGPESEIIVQGGTIDWNTEVIESSLALTSGSVSSGFRAFDSNITQTGGQFTTLELFKGSTFSMTGGEVVSTVTLQRDSQANLISGTIGGLSIGNGGVATVSGVEVEGSITLAVGGQLDFAGSAVEGMSFSGGRATLRGGGLGDDFTTGTSAEITFHGSDFRINGQPVTEFNTVHQIQSEGDTITGVLADGTPFVLVDDYNEDSIVGGKLLFIHEPHTQGPASLDAATSPKLAGIHNGQTLRVNTGASVRENFVAGPGSNLIIAGGTVGSNLEVFGGTVRLDSGNLSGNADVFDGATLEVFGGSVKSGLDIHPGGKMFVRGGDVASLDNYGHLVFEGGKLSYMYAYEGAITEIRSGTFDNYYYDSTDAKLLVSGGRLTRALSISEEVSISGGTFESSLSLSSGSHGVILDGVFQDTVQLTNQALLTIEGGQFDDVFSISSGATLNLVGEYFLLDGVPITGFTSLDDTQLLAARTGQLKVGFADGGSHVFNLSATQQSGYDYFHTGASIYLTKLPSDAGLLGDFNGDGLVNLADYTVWRDHLGESDTHLSAGSTNDGTGIVDAGDYATWRAHFGTAGGNLAGSESQVVPEPSTLLLLTAPALLLFWKRRASVRPMDELAVDSAA